MFRWEADGMTVRYDGTETRVRIERGREHEGLTVDELRGLIEILRMALSDRERDEPFEPVTDDEILADPLYRTEGVCGEQMPDGNLCQEQAGHQYQRQGGRRLQTQLAASFRTIERLKEQLAFVRESKGLYTKWHTCIHRLAEAQPNPKFPGRFYPALDEFSKVVRGLLADPAPPLEAIHKLFQWRDALTDRYGDDLSALLYSEFSQRDVLSTAQKRVPEEHRAALAAFQAMSEEEQVALCDSFAGVRG